MSNDQFFERTSSKQKCFGQLLLQELVLRLHKHTTLNMKPSVRSMKQGRADVLLSQINLLRAALPPQTNFSTNKQFEISTMRAMIFHVLWLGSKGSVRDLRQGSIIACVVVKAPLSSERTLNTPMRRQNKLILIVTSLFPSQKNFSEQHFCFQVFWQARVHKAHAIASRQLPGEPQHATADSPVPSSAAFCTARPSES